MSLFHKVVRDAHPVLGLEIWNYLYHPFCHSLAWYLVVLSVIISSRTVLNLAAAMAAHLKGSRAGMRRYTHISSCSTSLSPRGLVSLAGLSDSPTWRCGVSVVLVWPLLVGVCSLVVLFSLYNCCWLIFLACPSNHRVCLRCSIRKAMSGGE